MRNVIINEAKKKVQSPSANRGANVRKGHSLVARLLSQTVFVGDS